MSELSSELIVGLEIHVQLRTRSKLFCGCPVEFSSAPNENTCPVCLGHPGALPSLNREALELAIRASVALNCEISPVTKWDRKSYFYPDLPKGYQISQFDQPLAINGWLEFDERGVSQRVRIRRAHLEEDAGKSFHNQPDSALVDLNRAGVPLLEIVTEPDMANAEDVYAFCRELHSLMVYLGVSEGVMQRGQMRFEPNVNLRITDGSETLYTPICEIKNLNSFRAVRDAVRHEERRQFEEFTADSRYRLGLKPNENRGWVDELSVTRFQRPKEEAHDYRYFPDPDLRPVVIPSEVVRKVRDALPEMPSCRRRRFEDDLGLRASDADVILVDAETADLFEMVLAEGAPPVLACSQFVNIWMKMAADRNVTVCDLGVAANRMAELCRITHEGLINRTAASAIADAMLTTNEPPSDVAKTMGLVQIGDESVVRQWLVEAIRRNPDAWIKARSGSKKAKAAAAFILGQVMKSSGGRADPEVAARILNEWIETGDPLV